MSLAASLSPTKRHYPAALLRDYVPEFKSAPGDIKAAIAPFL